MLQHGEQLYRFSDPTKGWNNKGHGGKQEKSRSDENWPKIPFQGWSGVERWVNNQFGWSSVTLELEVGTIQPLRFPVTRHGPLQGKPRVAVFFMISIMVARNKGGSTCLRIHRIAPTPVTEEVHTE